MTKRVYYSLSSEPGAKISKSYISEAVTLAIAAIPFVFSCSTSCFWQYLYPRLILFLDTFKEVHTLQQCHRMRCTSTISSIVCPLSAIKF
jgi:hypothetical protein